MVHQKKTQFLYFRPLVLGMHHTFARLRMDFGGPREGCLQFHQVFCLSLERGMFANGGSLMPSATGNRGASCCVPEPSAAAVSASIHLNFFLYSIFFPSSVFVSTVSSCHSCFDCTVVLECFSCVIRRAWARS